MQKTHMQKIHKRRGIQRIIPCAGALALAACLVLALPATPAHAGKKEDKQAELIEKMRRLAIRERAEQIHRNIHELKSRTYDLKREIRNENIEKKDTVGKYTDRVDDEYLDRLREISTTGDKERWNRVYRQYMAERANAMAKDAKRAEERNKKEPNPFLNPEYDPWDKYR